MMKAVDPNEVIEAMSGLYQILLAVIATLRLKFAAAVTLGCSIGDMFHASIHVHARPLLEKNISPEYHKWIDPGIKYSSQAVGVFLAWILQRIMSAIHCSLRGAFLFVSSSQDALVKLGYISSPVLEKDSTLFSGAVMLLALIGFLSQASYGFGLPFPLNLLFLPVYVLEFVITQMIGSV